MSKVWKAEWKTIAGINRFPEKDGKKGYKGVELKETDDGRIVIRAADSGAGSSIVIAPTAQELLYFGHVCVKMAERMIDSGKEDE